MRLALLAAGLMALIAVGIFIGLTGFQQYAIESSRSMAGSVVCAPDRPVAAPGQTVMFNIAGLPDGVLPQWSSADGSSGMNASGRFSVTYSTRGEKTVSVFFRTGDMWERSQCNVSVQ